MFLYRTFSLLLLSVWFSFLSLICVTIPTKSSSTLWFIPESIESLDDCRFCSQSEWKLDKIRLIINSIISIIHPDLLNNSEGRLTWRCFNILHFVFLSNLFANWKHLRRLMIKKSNLIFSIGHFPLWAFVVRTLWS